MAGLDMGRCQSIEFSIVHIDVEIGQKSPLWPHPLDPFQGALEMGVRRVRAEAHGIDNQHLDPLHDLERVIGERDDIVGIGHRPEAEAE